MAQTLRVVARLVAFPDKVEELKTVLMALVQPTRAEDGCLQYDLLQNQTDPTDFTFVEEWTSQAALDQHLASDHIQVALRQLDGLAVGNPDIRCYRPC